MTDHDDSTKSLRNRLWWITLAPSIWASHFLACYLTAAIWCEKFVSPQHPFSEIDRLVAIYTAIALSAILFIGWKSYRHYDRGGSTLPDDFDDPQERGRFLGFAALLLACLSVVATLFTAIVFVIVRSCD